MTNPAEWPPHRRPVLNFLSIGVDYPLMVAIQEVRARIGRTLSKGIAAHIREQHSPSLLNLIVGGGGSLMKLPIKVS